MEQLHAISFSRAKNVRKPRIIEIIKKDINKNEKQMGDNRYTGEHE